MSSSSATGEPMGASDTTTVQLAVPPRCSGPYEGQEGDVQSLREGAFTYHLADSHDALSAEARY